MTTVTKVHKAWTMTVAERATITYVGNRAFGWSATPLGNPYRWKEFGHDRAVALYAGLIADEPNPEAIAAFPADRGDPWATREAIRDALPGLRGKCLGCWCGDWRPGSPRIACHACVLAVLADGETW